MDINFQQYALLKNEMIRAKNGNWYNAGIEFPKRSGGKLQ